MALSEQDVKLYTERMTHIVDNIETVIVGKRKAIEIVVVSLVAGGHVLIEDVPGVGKTTLVSALAKSVDCTFRRIQFTPDLMPSDVTGFSIFNQQTRQFEFRPGGIMSNIVLADEINRASAKTQAALLEAMEERQVTVDSQTYKLEEPFMVLATQNPIESMGTYPLPEAQVDRFLVKMSIGYPDYEEEIKVVENGDAPKRSISAVVGADELIELQQAAKDITASHEVIGYVVQLVMATRNHPDVLLGSSPRGSVALTAASKAYALYQGRDYVIPDDVKYLVPYVLAHRIQLTHEAKMSDRTAAHVLDEIMGRVAVPIN